MSKLAKIGVLVLSAGKSERMGTLKAFLAWDSQQCFIERIVSQYREFGCDKIAVTFNERGVNFYKEKGFSFLDGDSIVLNHHPEYERFYSLKIGLEAIEDCDYYFVQDSDNPFVSIDMLEKLSAHKGENTFVRPVFKGRGGHPVLLGKRIIESILALEGFDHNLREVLNNFERVDMETEDDKVLVNINDREEYGRYFGVE